jgi:hypothetical protein
MEKPDASVIRPALLNIEAASPGKFGFMYETRGLQTLEFSDKKYT